MSAADSSRNGRTTNFHLVENGAFAGVTWDLFTFLSVEQFGPVSSPQVLLHYEVNDCAIVEDLPVCTTLASAFVFIPTDDLTVVDDKRIKLRANMRSDIPSDQGSVFGPTGLVSVDFRAVPGFASRFSGTTDVTTTAPDIMQTFRTHSHGQSVSSSAIATGTVVGFPIGTQFQETSMGRNHNVTVDHTFTR
jgi:hypothetical protein